MNFDEQVTTRGTRVPRLTVTLHAEPHPAVYPGRDVDRECPFYPCIPAAPAFGAFLLGDLSPAHTFIAGAHAHKLSENSLAGLLELACPIAAGTGFLFFCLAPGPVTCCAWLAVHHLDLFVRARYCLFEGDLHPHQHVVSGLRATGSTCTPAH